MLQARRFDPALDIVCLGVRQVGDGWLSGKLREPDELNAQPICLLQSLFEGKLQFVEEYPQLEFV